MRTQSQPQAEPHSVPLKTWIPTEGLKVTPLALETRSHVNTEEAAAHLLRKPQTLRGWACAETFPDGLRPVRINGRLGWPVAGIRRVLGVAA